MKLHDILKEEMGLFGMDKIRKNFMRIVKESGLSSQDYDIGTKGGTYYMIYKNRKPFARVPSAKAMDKSYISSILKKEFQ